MRGIGGFLAMLQYFGKHANDSVDIMFEENQGKLTKDFIEYNGNHYFSITAFAQKAFHDIYNNTTTIESTQLAAILIHGESYAVVRDNISRKSKSLPLQYNKLEEEDTTNQPVETSIEFNPTKEDLFQLFPVGNIALAIHQVSHGLLQLVLFSKREVALEIQIVECGFKKTFPISQDEFL